MQGKCLHCGISFEYEYKGGGKRKYCSLSCQRLEQKTRYHIKYKEKVSEYNHRGHLALALASIYNGKCAICGWRAAENIPKGWMYNNGNEVHHIIPVREGGQANYKNLILLCPNHHKQADMGILTREQLAKYLREPPNEEERQKMKNNAIDNISNAIFG